MRQKGASQSLPLVQPRPSEQWSAGTFAAELAGLIRRFRVWHVNDFLAPIRFVHPTSAEGWRITNRTFRDEIEGLETREPSPQNMRLFAADGGEREACVLVDRDTDRTRACWLLADFVCHVARGPKSSLFDFARGVLDQLLALPAWTLLRRQDLPDEPWPPGDEDKGMVCGNIVDPAILADLESVQSRLLDLVEREVETESIELPPVIEQVMRQKWDAIQRSQATDKVLTAESSDSDVYDWIKEEGEVNLAKKGTWLKYQQRGRKRLKQPRSSPRGGRPRGRTIVGEDGADPGG